MNKALVLTLGHNSSAIYVVEGKIVCGYEEERLSGKKSDSAFPIKAIKEIMSQYNLTHFDSVYIGHWFTAGELVNSKYYDFEIIKNLVNGKEEKIFSIVPFEFTHHDSHIEAAEVFAKAYGLDAYNEPKTLGLVIDGFGTFGENLTIYDYKDSKRSVIFRSFGHDKSLGLMFQYATLYLGMKMNNHEYKMLGYEAHIHKVLSADKIRWLDQMVDTEVAGRTVAMLSNIMNSDTDPLVNVAALNEVQKKIFKTLDTVANGFVPEVAGNEFNLRVVISYFIQSVLEKVVLNVLNEFQEKHGFDNIILSGGTFYNVKLNAAIEKITPKTISVYPLAGDQGAGLGVYNWYEKDLDWPTHLNWGQRNFGFEDIAEIDEYNNQAQIPITIIDSGVKSTAQIAEYLTNTINEFGFVNFVSNTMEFGPRALCQTSTIAKPTLEMVDAINKLNDRTFVMPMAPFMTQDQFEQMSASTLESKYAGSLKFMITACEFRKYDELYPEGALHTYGDGKQTFRPQVIHGSFLVDILNELGPLINTSFNNHGKPIVFSTRDIIECHDFMVSNLSKTNLTTVPTIILL